MFIIQLALQITAAVLHQRDTDTNPIYGTLDRPGACKRGLVEVRCCPAPDNGFPILGDTWPFDQNGPLCLSVSVQRGTVLEVINFKYYRESILFDGSHFYPCKLAISISIRKQRLFLFSIYLNNEPRTFSNL